MALTWALTIATYNRHDILRRCINCALNQTQSPKEIIIVDASDDFARHKKSFSDLSEACTNKGILWKYQEAETRSSAAQRNQGMKLATADILFMIDDDSLMYTDCAERIMEIYEADNDARVAGVSAVHVAQAPDRPAPQTVAEEKVDPTKPKYGLLAQMVRSLLSADDIFVPYDADFPKWEIPESVAELPVARRPLLVGYAMTMRRELALREPFENIMRYYAAGEDSDQSYRLSRHGILLTAVKARLHHAKSSGGRLDQRVVMAMGAMNPAVTHRIYSPDSALSYKRLKRMWWRRLIIRILGDLAKREFHFYKTRGWWMGMGELKRIFSMDEAQLRQWYPQYQQDLMNRYRKT